MERGATFFAVSGACQLLTTGWILNTMTLTAFGIPDFPPGFDPALNRAGCDTDPAFPARQAGGVMNFSGRLLLRDGRTECIGGA